jgi:copper chaperone CopZ
MNKEKNIKVINFITFYKFLITVIRIETTEIIVNAGKLNQENIHAIKNQITSLNSIGRVIIKPSRKSITVVYDARVVSKNEIVSALRQIGYSINRIK